MPAPSVFGKLSLVTLETRDTPTGLTSASFVADTFEQANFPFLPAGWQQWASNGQDYFGTTRATATSGSQSIAIYGTTNVTGRFWNQTAISGDEILWANVRADVPAPITIIGRGVNLDSNQASYVGVSIAPGGVVQLRESRGGTERIIQTVQTVADLPRADWLRVSFFLSGDVAFVRVQRVDDGRFLSVGGTWETTPTDAIAQQVTHIVPSGFAGIIRNSGPYGTAFVDDLAAIPLNPIPPTAAITPAPEPEVTPELQDGSFPRHYSHIRLAQLAYNGTPVTDVERAQLANSIDLVIPNPRYLESFEQTAPDTPKIIYSNVSNVYQELLTDYLSFADANNLPRESAFYHVNAATPFSGASPSSVPVRNFWYVSRQSTTGIATDLTSNAREGRAIGVGFGASGEAVTLGFTDKFREVNLTLNRGAQAGHAGQWEYATASGEWRTLQLVGDSSNALRNSGTITFDPPTDWAPTQVVGSIAQLFTVRYRTTAGAASVAPDAKSIYGRDYVNANGRQMGTIPAFDSNADRDGDGYLTDAEYATRQGGFDARFVSESRLFYPFYGQMRFVTNPGSTVLQSWAGQYHVGLLAANPLADGVFLDNQNGKLPFTASSVLESTRDYSTQAASLVASVRSALGSRFVVANTVGARAEANAVGRAAGITLEEFAIRPTVASWATVNDVVDLLRQRLAGDDKPLVILDSHPGGTLPTDARTQLGVLAYYYIVADPEQTLLMFFGGSSPAAGWDKKFTAAATVDVGQPQETFRIFATGADPQNAELAYRVLAREYDNALVLYKPRSYNLGKGTGSIGDSTATTHELGGNYRAIQADGSLGPVIRSITLRNGEGAVLHKA